MGSRIAQAIGRSAAHQLVVGPAVVERVDACNTLTTSTTVSMYVTNVDETAAGKYALRKSERLAGNSSVELIDGPMIELKIGEVLVVEGAAQLTFTAFGFRSD